MKIRYKLEDGALPPSYAKPGDAGADLALKLKTCEDVPDVLCSIVSGYKGGRQADLLPGQGAWFQTGVSFEIPEGYEGQIRPRSSCHTKGLSVAIGTIDSGYRGQVGIYLRNVGNDVIALEHGQRVAQIVFAPVVRAEFEQAESLSESERGQDGFGSTGK